MSGDGWMHAYHAPGWDDAQASTAESELAGVRATSDGVCGYSGCDDPILKDQRVVAVTGRRPRKRAAKKVPVEVVENPGPCVAPAEFKGSPQPPDDVPGLTSAITEPGLYEDMPNDVYHSDPWVGGSVSNSDAKLLLEAPALYRWRRDNPSRSSRAMNLGSAAHTRVLGAGDKLVKIAAAEYRTNDSKAARDAAYAAGEIPLLGVRKYPDKPCEWEVVDAMAEALERDPLAPYLFAEGRAEVSAFWIDVDTGVPRRARFDFLPDAVDGKTMIVPDYKSKTGSLSPEAFAKSVIDFGYDMQDFTYTSALAALKIDVDAAFVFVVQSPEPPYLVAVHQLGEREREHGRSRTLRALRRWLQCRETGWWWGWEGKVHQVRFREYLHDAEAAAAAREAAS